MTTIRENVFETNSSSMHAIVISRVTNGSLKEMYKGPIIFDLAQDFSERRLIKRDSPSEKASYLFHLICSKACHVMPHHPKAKPYTEKEIEAIHRYYDIFKGILDKTQEHYKKEGIIVEFKNYKLFIDKEIGLSYITSEEGWTSTGCYGHDSFIEALYIDGLFNRIIDEQVGEKIIDEDSSYWYDMDDLLNFVMDDKSIIIQGSDEMDDDEIEKQKKLVLKYVKKSGGDASVIWPLGG